MPKNRRSSRRKKTSSAAAASDGFGGAGGGRYTQSADQYSARYNAFWRLAPNQNVQNDNVLHFQMTTRPDQMIR
jgi:hypothetical protein